MNKKAARLLSLCALLIFQTTDLPAQDSPLAELRRYEAVLAELFPPIDNYRPPFGSRSLILRFVYGPPAVYTELQLLIFAEGSEAERYEVWRVPKGAPSISKQVEEIQARLGTDDPKAIASSIRIQHVVINRPTKALQNLAKRVDKLRFSPVLDRGFSVDGVFYEFFVRSSYGNTASIRVDDSAKHPLVSWMEAMRTAVEKQIDSQ
jgi:hypothetical protein